MFFGTVVYPAPWYGYVECDFTMIFSEDYMSIESGTVFFKTAAGDGYTNYYGVEYFYYRDLEAECHVDDGWIDFEEDYAESGRFFRVSSDLYVDWYVGNEICYEYGGELAMIFLEEETE